MAVQEQVNDKIVALVINTGKGGLRHGTRLTSQMLAKSFRAFGKMKEKASSNRAASIRMRNDSKANKGASGKVPLKTLTAKDDATKSLDVADKSLRSFDRTARKYGVSYSVVQSKGNPGQFTVFFKAKHSDQMEAAFKEYADSILRSKNKVKGKSILATMRENAARLRNTPAQTKEMTRSERSL